MLLTHRLTIFAAGLGAGWLAANAFREPQSAPVVTAPARTVVAVPAAPLTAIESVAAKVPPDASAGMPDDALISPPPLPAGPEPLVVKPAQTSDEASALMEAILRLPDDAERVTHWQEMLAQMTPENFALYHDAWRLGVSRRGSPAPQSMLYNRRAGELAGPEVVGVRDGYGEKDMMGAVSFVKDQFQGWITADAVAAERWLDGLQHPAFRAAMEMAWDEMADAAGAAVPGTSGP